MANGHGRTTDQIAVRLRARLTEHQSDRCAHVLRATDDHHVFALQRLTYFEKDRSHGTDHGYGHQRHGGLPVGVIVRRRVPVDVLVCSDQIDEFVRLADQVQWQR